MSKIIYWFFLRLLYTNKTKTYMFLGLARKACTKLLRNNEKICIKYKPCNACCCNSCVGYDGCHCSRL